MNLAVGTKWIILGSGPGQKIGDKSLTPSLDITSTTREGQVGDSKSLLSTTTVFVPLQHVDDIACHAALCHSGN